MTLSFDDAFSWYSPWYSPILPEGAFTPNAFSTPTQPEKDVIITGIDLAQEESPVRVISHVNIKKAWGRMVEAYALATQALDTLDSPFSKRWTQSPAIMDMIQTEYREGHISEAERDAMRAHVTTYVPSGSIYACGLWAATTGPMGLHEHAIILSVVVILEQEAV
jgi:hypothetical protein